jgi:hypothetical protein
MDTNKLNTRSVFIFFLLKITVKIFFQIANLYRCYHNNIYLWGSEGNMEKIRTGTSVLYSIDYPYMSVKYQESITRPRFAIMTLFNFKLLSLDIAICCLSENPRIQLNTKSNKPGSHEPLVNINAMTGMDLEPFWKL